MGAQEERSHKGGKNIDQVSTAMQCPGWTLVPRRYSSALRMFLASENHCTIVVMFFKPGHCPTFDADLFDAVCLLVWCVGLGFGGCLSLL